MVNNPFSRFFTKLIEAEKFHIYGKREDKAVTTTQTQWTDKQQHPANMNRYEEVSNDPEVSISFSLLSDLIAPNYYTEMPDEYKPKTSDEPPHKHKQTIDEYGERVNLDEKLKIISRIMISKGFCPVQRLADYDLHILPPEGFYIWRTKTGDVYRYTQEVNNAEVRRWQRTNWQETLESVKECYEPKEFKLLLEDDKEATGKFEDITLFINHEDPLHPYGHSLSDPIVDLVEARQQINQDMPNAIHRFAYPIGLLRSIKDTSKIRDAFANRDTDEWVSIGNVAKDEVEWDIIEAGTRQDWIPYIELIYYQICEALHAPLLLYLKNATEASANVMLEAVDRYVDGRQRYIKRRVERYFFKPQVKDPVPRLVWGQPQTGLEEITLDQVASVLPYMAKNQQQDVLKHFLSWLPDPEPEPEPKPQLPFQPFQKTQEIPIEQVLEKLNDLQTSLNIIETSYIEKKITITDACRRADQTITVYMKRAYPNNWEEQRDQKFQEYVRRLMGVKKEGKWLVEKVERTD